MKSKRFIGAILSAATMVVAVDGARAAVLYWDADGNAANNVANGASGGTGTWNDANALWFDGANPGTEIAWTNGNDAVFGGTGGNVTLSPTSPATSYTPVKVTINSDGYAFFGSSLAPTGTGDAVLINGNAQIGNFKPTGNTVIASGKTLTFATGFSSPRKVTGGAVSLTGGTAGVGNIVLNSALTQSGGTANATASGNAATIGSTATGTWTLSQNAAVLNVSNDSSSATSSVTLDVGSGNLGNGTLTVNAGSASVVNGALLRIGVGATGATSTTTGTVKVAGGTFTATGSNAATGVNSTVYIVDSGSGVTGALAISGGTATIDSIRFGRTATAGQGALTLSGGSLYVGSGGIATGTLPAANAAITLSGGTMGARADWSSTLAMALSGPTTIKAADASDVARSIVLSGNLTGTGALTKSGAGKLTVGSAGYTGATQVTAGTFEVNGTIATSGITVDSAGTLQGTGTITNGVTVNGIVAPAGTSTGTLRVGSATFGTGSGFNVNVGPSSTSDLLAVTGSLDISQSTLNLIGVADGTSYVIATYGGTLTGTFANANLPADYVLDYGTGTNSQISLVQVPEPVLGLLVPGALLALGRRFRRKH